MVLEGEERETHVGEDEVLCQEVEHLKQLMVRRDNSKNTEGKLGETGTCDKSEVFLHFVPHWSHHGIICIHG